MRVPNDDLPLRLVELEGKITNKMSETERRLYEHEFGLIDDLAAISERLLPLKIEERRAALINELKSLRLHDDLYVPSHPNYRIIAINTTKSLPLKSHSRVPILVSFEVYDQEDAYKIPTRFSCIFKIQDVVRMDAMMIQFIDKFQRIFKDAGLKTYMNAYRVFATGQESGVIECIQKANSRHDMGTKTNEDLLHYFIRKYGHVGTEAFDTAQQNFIQSLAPYSLLCYIFQVKDRHNANIMFDKVGHVLHIDFGFIFEIAPGGGFEMAPFKFTNEMMQLLGGSREALPFRQFEKLFIQGFLAARARYNEIEPIASLMMNAGFPCFKKDALKKLQQRFFLEKPDYELASNIEAVIADAIGAVTTSIYDKFQHQQNNIFYS